MNIVVTGAYGQLGGELCRQLGAEAIPLDIDTLDLTDGPAVVERMLASEARGDHQLRRLYPGGQGRERAGEVPGRQRGGRRAPGAGVRPARLPAGADQHRLRVRRGVPRRRGRGAKTIRRRRKAFMPGRSWKASGPPPRHPKHLIVRTCGLYARPSDPRAANFVRTMLRLGGTRPELRVVADQHCTPTYVPHLARAILFLLGAATAAAPAPWGTYHVTNTGADDLARVCRGDLPPGGDAGRGPADHHGRVRRAGAAAVVQRARHGGLPSARRAGDARLESGAGGVFCGVEGIADTAGCKLQAEPTTRASPLSTNH